MKKGITVSAIAMAAVLFSAAGACAQENDTSTVGQDLKKAAQETGHAVKKGAKKVGNKTAELASKGKSAVVDKVYEDKKGPDGQTIYINNKSQYYWVDKKGHHHFVDESDLKDPDE